MKSRKNQDAIRNLEAEIRKLETEGSNLSKRLENLRNQVICGIRFGHKMVNDSTSHLHAGRSFASFTCTLCNISYTQSIPEGPALTEKEVELMSKSPRSAPGRVL